MKGLQALDGRLQGGSLWHPRSHDKVGNEQVEALRILQVEPMVAILKNNLHVALQPSETISLASWMLLFPTQRSSASFRYIPPMMWTAASPNPEGRREEAAN